MRCLALMVVVSVLLLPVVAEAEEPRLVTFFLHPDGECPTENWREAVYARGRMIRPLTDEKYIGATLGAPFRPAERSTHIHAYDLTWQQKTLEQRWLPVSQYADAVGVWRAYSMSDPPEPVWQGVSGKSSAAELGFPFFQAVLCEQQADDGLIDVLPKDSVAFFHGTACPEREDPGLEWVPYKTANGRFVVPLVEQGQHEAVVGTPWFGFMTPLLDPLHHHDAGRNVSADLNRIENLATTPSYSPQWFENPESTERYRGDWWIDARDSTLSLSTEDEHSLNAVPSVALLVCRKRGEDQASEPKPSPYFTFFRATGDCASYYRVPATMGRFLVALPEHALPNQAFGTPLEDREKRTHTHNPVTYNAGDLPTMAVRKGSGSKHGGALAPGSYAWTLAPTPSNPEIPYIQLAHCWPKIPEDTP
jgi:hypothetical protein